MNMFIFLQKLSRTSETDFIGTIIWCIEYGSVYQNNKQSLLEKDGIFSSFDSAAIPCSSLLFWSKSFSLLSSWNREPRNAAFSSSVFIYSLFTRIKSSANGIFSTSWNTKPSCFFLFVSYSSHFNLLFVFRFPFAIFTTTISYQHTFLCSQQPHLKKHGYFFSGFLRFPLFLCTRYVMLIVFYQSK